MAHGRLDDPEESHNVPFGSRAGASAPSSLDTDPWGFCESPKSGAKYSPVDLSGGAVGGTCEVLLFLVVPSVWMGA